MEIDLAHAQAEEASVWMVSRRPATGNATGARRLRPAPLDGGTGDEEIHVVAPAGRRKF